MIPIIRGNLGNRGNRSCLVFPPTFYGCLCVIKSVVQLSHYEVVWCYFQFLITMLEVVRGVAHIMLVL